MSVNVANTSTNPHTLSHSPKPPSSCFSTYSSPASRSLDRFLILRSNSGSSNSLKLSRSQSCITHTNSTIHPLRRSCSASYHSDPISDGSYLEELDHDSTEGDTTFDKNAVSGRSTKFGICDMEILEPSSLGIRPEPPEWTAREEIIKDKIARKANSIEMPLSLRMIKLKKSKEFQPHEPLLRREFNSIEMSFGSAIYIIKEIQKQALYLRGIILGKDLESKVKKVEMDMNHSFVLLFREVFSSTPVLMTDTMILVANFATYSMENHIADAKAYSTSLRKVVCVKDKGSKLKKLKDKSIASTVDVVHCEGEEAHEDSKEEDEAALWNAMVEEAHRMEREIRGDVLDKETVLRFVAPVKVEMEADDYVEYDRTHLLYRIALSDQPHNPLLLSNYAKFLFLVVGDHDRAEEYFQRALQVDSDDAEVLSLYATFLWIVRKDLWGAEERYIQAVAAAAPDNIAHYSSMYASFLWGTGGEDTCYPIH